MSIEASLKPTEEFVKMADMSSVCNEIGVGANREPEQVANISMLDRVFVTGMILYDVGVENVASRHDLHNNYINFLMELIRQVQLLFTFPKLKTL